MTWGTTSVFTNLKRRGWRCTLAASLGFTTSIASAQEVHFRSSFESVADFAGFYIVPVKPDSSAAHRLDDREVLTGEFSHFAWIIRSNEESTARTNRNHRAYPTIQFHKTQNGVLSTPLCVSLYVWADFDLEDRLGRQEDQWFSLATFTDDASDHWRRTILVNVSHDGLVHLQHVPQQGQQDHIFQSIDVLFPYRQWVHLEIELDFSSAGYAKVWLDNELVSHANVEAIRHQLAQAHFGLYAAPSLSTGEIRNEDISFVSGQCN